MPLLAALALIGLASCDMPAPVDPAPVTSPRPGAKPRPAPSAASVAMARHFARVQADLVARGLLRTDGGGPDVPFSARTLADNFVKIALYDEYTNQGGHLVARSTKSRLRRWEEPVQLGVVFGDSVTPENRAVDQREVRHFARRLTRASGFPVTVTSPKAANFHVLFLSEDDRRDFAPRIRALVPGIDHRDLKTIIDMPRSTFCLVFAFSKGTGSTYTHALAVIRAEHPDLLRKSCIHEELAQGLGLANDSPNARPSVFNDDEEFAFLTTHDELLLKMLYDPRLTPGMTPEQARPTVQMIAAELLGGES